MRHFKAFISYRHSTYSRDHAVALEQALKRYAKPLFKPPIAIFRDEQVLRPGDDLPATLRKALERSEYLIYLATSDAAESPWVLDELLIWCEQLGREDKLIIAHIDDDIVVDAKAQRINWSATNALPGDLEHIITSLPIYMDLSWAREDSERDLNNTRYKSLINGLVARMRNVTPESMMGTDVLIHRRNVRKRNAFIAAIAFFAVSAAVAAVVAWQQKATAETQARIALSRLASAQAQQIAEQPNEFDGFLDRALLLAGEAVQLDNSVNSRNTLIRVLQRMSDRRPFPVQVLRGHVDEVNSVAFSPDGSTLASGSLGIVQLWDVATARAIDPPLKTGVYGPVWDVAFNPNGNLLATAGGFDFAVRLWDLAAAEINSTILLGHTNQVWSVEFSPDGRLLASSDIDGNVRLWDIQTEPPASIVLKGHMGGVESVSFSSDGKLLASADRDGKLIIWDVETKKPVGKSLPGYRAVFSPSAARLAVAGAEGSIRQWDVPTNKWASGTSPRTDERVRWLEFSPSGQQIASAGLKTQLQLWDADTMQAIGEPLAGHEQLLTTVAFSPDGRLLASAGRDATVRLWNLRDDLAAYKQWALGPVERQTHDGIFGVAFSPDGRTVASAATGFHREISLWDVASGDPVTAPLVGHQASILTVAFSSDGKMLASGDTGKNIYLWDITTGSRTGGHLLGHRASVTSLAFSPDNRLLASASKDETVRLWDVTAGKPVGKPLRGHNKWVLGVTFSPDGQSLASVGANLDRTVRLWDVATQEPIGEPLLGHEGSVTNVAFSPDGRLLVSSSKDRTLRVWNVETGKPVGRPLYGHTAEVLALAFSTDGQTLASAGEDRVVKLWDVNTWQPLGEGMQGHTNGIFAVTFSQDGRQLASTGRDQLLHVWSLDWVAQACRIAQRNLRSTERESYLLNGYPPICGQPGSQN